MLMELPMPLTECTEETLKDIFIIHKTKQCSRNNIKSERTGGEPTENISIL